MQKREDDDHDDEGDYDDDDPDDSSGKFLSFFLCPYSLAFKSFGDAYK